MTPGRKKIESVLAYFSSLQKAAEGRNKRLIVNHWRECWSLVHEAYYGVYKLPQLPVVYHQLEVWQPKTMAERPVWFQEKYSHPMRRVVARHIKDGQPYDVLGCGHQLADYSAMCDHKPARHRRCKVCTNNGVTLIGTRERVRPTNAFQRKDRLQLKAVKR